MSNIVINGTLLLDGNATCDENFTVTTHGKVIPVPDALDMKSYWSENIHDFITSNGAGRTITSDTGSIFVNGIIDGNGEGYDSNMGPGANSVLTDNLGFQIRGYGATHAGVGGVNMLSGAIYTISEEFRLDAQDLLNKHIHLMGRPATPEDVALNIIDGVPQLYGVDYYVEGNILKWDGRVLESQLVVGDILRVLYEGDTSPLAPPPKHPYGNHEKPVSLGSGSGFYHDPELVEGVNVPGGGAIKLVARSGEVNIAGTVTVDGEDGWSVGGGSGGSIWIVAWKIDGTGNLFARGGNSFWIYGGGGGGGYISLWHDKENSFSGVLSVDGRRGGIDGKIFMKKMEPIMEEKFTGHVWNTKWWETFGDTTQNNYVRINSPDGSYDPAGFQSLFSLSGKNILADMDYFPNSSEPAEFSESFLLYVDARNWVGIARKQGNLFGVYALDGVPSQTALPFPATDLTFRINKHDSTFAFQFYDSTSLPQTIYSEVIPELANSRFYIRGEIDNPDATGNWMTECLRLTSADEANRYLTLSGYPNDETNIALNLIGGTSQYYGMDFYVDGNQVKWDASGLSAFVPPFTMLIIEDFVLTANDIINSYITLSKTPNIPEDTVLNVIHGVPQMYGEDYEVHTDLLTWKYKPLESTLIVGEELRVIYYWTPWQSVPLETLLSKGDVMRIMYPVDMTSNWTSCLFDSLKIYDGIIYDAETREPNVYVDPEYGSDSSDGRQLTPLKNLFVATAWARHGGNVVLYDGTHNPAEIRRKNLTIMGAYGAQATITTQNVQDTTGSGWETNCLSFYGSQSSVQNIIFADSSIGVTVENTDNFEVSNIEARDCTRAIRFQKCNPSVVQSYIHDCQFGVDFTTCWNPYIYSNIIVDSSVGVYIGDCTGARILSNTIDNNDTGTIIDNSSSAVIVSNNITHDGIGTQISADSGPVYVGFNNYFDSTPFSGKAPDTTMMNISADPLYVDWGSRNYHLDSSSPNIAAGSDLNDTLWMDYDGVNRADVSSVSGLHIGAFTHFDGTHTDTDWYVTGSGNDYINFGNSTDPFKTLDRAYRVADSTIHIDGGHYDTFYLALKAHSTVLNTITMFTETINHMVSYITVTQADIDLGYVALPGFIPGGIGPDDISISMVHGSQKVWGTDYVVQLGYIVWTGYALESTIANGDTFRIIYYSAVQTKALNALTLAGNFSDYDQERAIFVSPNGSDSTVMGGDGTNTGGNGTYQLPFRTVDRALQDSSSGDNIVMIAGEYPLFSVGMDGRVIVPAIDRTGIVDKYERYYVEDMFAPRDFRMYNHVESDLIPWTFTYSGDSSVSVGGGFMNLTYDGSNTAWAKSIFTMEGDWEAYATVRNAVDPLFFSVTCPDQTVYFRWNDASYVAGAWTGGTNYYCWGMLDVPDTTYNQLITEYINIDSNDVRNKGVNLSFIPEPDDLDDISVNFVGGTAQDYGTDFIFNKGRIEWDGLEIDGDVEPGDIMRVIYKDRTLSSPVRVMLSKKGKRLTVKAYDTSWKTVFKRDMVGTATDWNVNFYMNEADSSVSHTFLNGKGFVSRFLAISDTLDGIDASPFQAKTERRVVIFYKDRT
jgi:hypothetical protein